MDSRPDGAGGDLHITRWASQAKLRTWPVGPVAGAVSTQWSAVTPTQCVLYVAHVALRKSSTSSAERLQTEHMAHEANRHERFRSLEGAPASPAPSWKTCLLLEASSHSLKSLSASAAAGACDASRRRRLSMRPMLVSTASSRVTLLWLWQKHSQWQSRDSSLLRMSIVSSWRVSGVRCQGTGFVLGGSVEKLSTVLHLPGTPCPSQSQQNWPTGNSDGRGELRPWLPRCRSLASQLPHRDERVAAVSCR